MNIFDGFEQKECHGPVMPFITFGLAVVNMISGSAEAEASSFNSKVEMENSRIAKKQMRAEMEKQDQERRLRRGADMVAAGSSNSGAENFEDLFAMNAMNEEMDLLTIKSDGLLRSREHRIQGELYRSAASNQKREHYISSGTKVLSTGSKAFGFA